MGSFLSQGKHFPSLLDLRLLFPTSGHQVARQHLQVGKVLPQQMVWPREYFPSLLDLRFPFLTQRYGVTRRFWQKVPAKTSSWPKKPLYSAAQRIISPTRDFKQIVAQVRRILTEQESGPRRALCSLTQGHQVAHLGKFLLPQAASAGSNGNLSSIR